MMLIDEFLDIPSELKSDRVIAKEKLFSKGSLNTNDKRYFQDYVKQIRWYARLAEDNIHIIPYNDKTRRYNEVEIITIILKDENLKELTERNKVNNAFFVQDKKLDRILDILFRFITYPQIIVLQYKNMIKLCVAHVTINQSDSSKFALDEIINTNWMNVNILDEFEISLRNDIQFENLNHENFYKFYSDIVDSIIRYNGSLMAGQKIELPADEIKRTTDRIEKLEKEIKILKSDLKKETQHPLRSKINNEIRNRRLELKDLKEGL